MVQPASAAATKGEAMTAKDIALEMNRILADMGNTYACTEAMRRLADRIAAEDAQDEADGAAALRALCADEDERAQGYQTLYRTRTDGAAARAEKAEREAASEAEGYRKRIRTLIARVTDGNAAFEKEKVRAERAEGALAGARHSADHFEHLAGQLEARVKELEGEVSGAGLDKGGPRRDAEFVAGYDVCDGHLSYTIGRKGADGSITIVANGRVALDKGEPAKPEAPRLWRCEKCGMILRRWLDMETMMHSVNCGGRFAGGRFVPDEEKKK